MERFFDGLSYDDLRQIATSLDDLPGAIALLLAERPHDVVAHVVVDRGGDGDVAVSDDNFMGFVRFLREVKNVDDPELDVFWAASTGDVPLLKAAQERGADLQVRSGVLIKRYAAFSSEFQSLQRDTPDAT